MNGAPRLLIVDVERRGHLAVEELAALLNVQDSYAVAGLEQAIAVLAQGGELPDYIVVDVGALGYDLLPELTSLLQMTAQTSRVVVVGMLNDLGFYKALKSKGVIEYLVHPSTMADIAASFVQQPAVYGHAPGTEKASKGMAVAFISAATGDGASTVAMNNAFAFVQDFHQPTVLVDMDYQFGMVARHLDIHAEFGIRELFEHPERGMDTTLISRMLFTYNGGLKIIGAPEKLRQLPAIPPEAVREFLTVLRLQFPCMVLDLPHLWTPWTAEVLAQVDRIIIVAQLSLRSVTHLSRMKAAFQEAGINNDKILVAVNRSGAKFREAITPQDFERVTLKPINFYLANDIKTIVSAENQGKTILEVGSSTLERQLREMAGALIRPMLPAGAMQPMEAPRRKRFALLEKK